MTRTKSSLLVAGGIIVAFLVGFGWQFVRAHGLASRLDQAEHDLVFERMGTALASAVIETQRGQFEPARRQASGFFTDLQDAVGQAPETGRPTLQTILQQRDQVITMLSRADPQAVSVLANMYVQYREAIGESIAGPSGTEPATTPPASTTSTTGG